MNLIRQKLETWSPDAIHQRIFHEPSLRRFDTRHIPARALTDGQTQTDSA